MAGTVAASERASLTWDQLRGQGPVAEAVIYKKTEQGDLRLHVYRPENGTEQPADQALPAIIFIHGGGWTSPGIWNLAPHNRYFAMRGMVAINIEYRLVRDDPVVRIGDCIADARDALRFVRREAAALGVDPERIAVAGESAGGHLAAALALLPGERPGDTPDLPSALILLNPVLDLAAVPWMKSHLSLAPRPSTPEGESWEDRAERYAPSSHVREGLPPTLLIHGAADDVVDVKQSERFASLMQAKENRAELKRMRGWKHAFALEGYGTEAQIVETLRMMDAFLAGLGWLDGPPTIAMPWRPQAFQPLFSEQDKQRRAHVQARSHDLRFWPFLDGQWLGIVNDPDGYTWFSFSTHSGTEHAQLFRYDPENDRITHVADLGQATGEKLTGHPPQDKIHGAMFVEGDSILAGTCEGHAIPGNPYRGGYWLKINRHSGEVENLGKSISEDGLLCVGYDPLRKLLYGQTNRKGWLTKLDLETGEETFLGIPWQGVIDRWEANEDPDKAKEIWPRGLDMMITSDGRVFGAKPAPGTFWAYDPASGDLSTFQVDMPLPAELEQLKAVGGAAESEAWRQWQASAFHLSQWNEQDQCFYLIRSFDQMLCRFYPPEGDRPGRIELMHPMGLSERRYNLRPAACVLVISGRRVFYTPHTGWGGVTHLTSYDLETATFTDHGPIVVEGGRRVNESHAMTVTPDGKLHLAAFVFNKEDSPDPLAPWAMRDKYPFHSRLVIIDPEQDLRLPMP